MNVCLTEDLAKNKTLIYYLLKQIVSEPISKVVPIEGAKTSYAYEVNNHLIVKFPSYRTLVSNWEIQSEDAPVLQKSFSFRIPQPILKEVYLSPASPQGMLASFYEKIAGRIIPNEAFANQPVEFKKCFFDQLADAAIQIHSINPKDLPVPPPKSEEVIRRMLPIRPNNCVFNHLFNTLLFFPVLGFDHVPQEQRILCHSDLHSANVCLDEKGNLVGILDFDTLNQGADFVEFRPFLYKKKEDALLFRQIYEKKVGKTVPDKDIRWMDTVNKVAHLSANVARFRKISTFKSQRRLPTSSRDRGFF